MLVMETQWVSGDTVIGIQGPAQSTDALSNDGHSRAGMLAVYDADIRRTSEENVLCVHTVTKTGARHFD